MIRCLHCAAAFDEGLVHRVEAGLATAERAAREHVEKAHDGPLEAILALGRERSGLTETQEGLIRAFASGRSDRELARDMGGKSESGIRNHRFQLRRRLGEAKILVALMALLAEREPERQRNLEYPPDLPTVDERIDVTEEEAGAIEARYFDPSKRPAMPLFPKRQKEKLVLLRRIARGFEPDRVYTETEINRILMPIHDDYASIRRYLIEYRFLEREADGSEYRRR